MITTELTKTALTITLDNERKLNCIGMKMLHQLEEAVTRVEKSPDVGVVVFKGAGEKAFSTGADIGEFTSLSAEKVEEWIRLGNSLFNRIEELPIPTIAFVDGYALGGGFELALACDFRLATTKAVFGNPEVANGWLPGWGGIARLRRLVGEAKAKEIVLLSEKLSVEEVDRLGLITKILTPGNESLELVEYIEKCSKIKREIYAMAKSALMDPERTTRGSDVEFDVMAARMRK